MFALIKFAFFTFVAIAVGILIGTVPVGGRTVADRLVQLYEAAPKPGQLLEGLKGGPAAGRPAAGRMAEPDRASAAPRPAGPAPAADAKAEADKAGVAPLTAGASNRPDRFSPADRDEVEKIIAARRARK